jgi:membrane fusion protein (multidrug efflux system)
MQRASVLTAAAVFGAIALAGGGLFAFKWRALHPPAAPAWEPSETVEVQAARQVDWQPMADLVGTVFALRSVELKNEVAGRVTTVAFQSDQVVEAGAPLLQLDDATERADLAAARANVQAAEADVAAADAALALALTEVRRLESIAAARVTPEIDLDRARAQVLRGKAERARSLAAVDQAKALEAQVQARLGKLTILAPFRGRAGLRLVHEGQYLAEGTSLVMFQEVADRIYLDFAIPQEYSARVQPGVTVMATSPLLGSGPVKIEVVAGDATIDFETRNQRVRAVVANPGGILRQGMFIPVRVPIEAPRPYVVIPTTAVRRTSYADQVFVVVAGEHPGSLVARQRFIKLGPTIGDDVIVLEGLKVGEDVATTGSFKLRDGVGVQRPAPAPPAAEATPAATPAQKG